MGLLYEHSLIKKKSTSQSLSHDYADRLMSLMQLADSA
jgi:hypothetical protein